MLDSTIYPKIDLNTYQKETQLKDGTKIIFRPMVSEDQDALYEFFKEVDKEEAQYLIANATINRRQFGWKWHLGTVRIFVHKVYRNIGLGHLIIEEIVDIAYKLGIEKLIVEIPDVNTHTIEEFAKSGFYRAAAIPNMVKDRTNMPVNVVVMMKDVKPAHDDDYDYDL